MTITVDTAKLPTLLTALRLPTIARLWPNFCATADKECWPAACLLAALAELELAEREQRRIQRHLAEARLPPGKTLDAFDFSLVPSLSKAQIMALAEGWFAAATAVRRPAPQPSETPPPAPIYAEKPALIRISDGSDWRGKVVKLQQCFAFKRTPGHGTSHRRRRPGLHH